MQKKIRAAIVGYGNIGQFAMQAIEAAEDFELAGVVRRDCRQIPPELAQVPLVQSIERLEAVDVALLCVPSRAVPATAQQILQRGINTVDSFDIHSDIVALRQQLTPIAKECNSVAVVAAGWDPGSDSILRTLLLAMAPRGVTYTNFGPGMSMGHSVAAKAIPGVRDALSVTVPLGTGIHRRMVYVELEPGSELSQVEQALKSDSYFASDETHVKAVASIAALKDMGHGVHLTHKGVSGSTHNQQFEFRMTINNPALTAQFMLSAARASLRQSSGAYTVIELPPVDFLPGEPEEWIGKLV
ncbi:MAG: diaminopimelate dehydrogenase [Enterobacteriaceae bacterium]